MSFKIVQTIEKGKKVLSTIPMEWENEGILYWNDSTALRENSLSIPDKASWPAMPCTVKRQKIFSLREALMEEMRMSRFLDTEDDIEDRPTKRQKLSPEINYNNLMPDLSKASFTSDTADTLPLFHIENVETIEDNNSKRTDADGESYYNVLFDSPEKFVKQEASVKIEESNKQLEIDRRLSNLEKIGMDTQNDVRWLKGTLSKILVLLERFDGAGMHVCDEPVEEGIDTSRFDAINKMLKIDSIYKLEDLELKLNDIDFTKVFVDCLAQLCGRSGKKEARKCKYIIFDHIFCRKFISTCSWTGVTHDKSHPKIKFSRYENIIGTIYKILKLADCKFNRCDMQQAISTILHNSASRLKHEMVKKVSDIKNELNNDD